MSAHSLCVSVFHFRSLKWKTRVYFIRPVAPTPRYEPSKLQNLHRNSAAGLPQNGPTWYGWHGFKQHIINNATDEFCKRL